MNKDELLAAIKRDRVTLDHLVARVPEHRMTEATLDADWSVKDVLAHITAWEQLCLKWIKENKREELTTGVDSNQQVDALNARLYAENTGRPLKEVLHESRHSFEQMLAAVEWLSEADLAVEPVWAPGRKLWQVIDANSADHYREHIEQLSRWLDGNASVTASPSAIFFDMDGTILDWTSGMEESWLESCVEHHDATWPHKPEDTHQAITVRRTWFWSDHARATRGRMDLDGASREIVRHAFDDLGLPDHDTRAPPRRLLPRAAGDAHLPIPGRHGDPRPLPRSRHADGAADKRRGATISGARSSGTSSSSTFTASSSKGSSAAASRMSVCSATR